MKYLTTILTIFLCVTVITLYFLWPQKPLSKDQVALTVNGQIVPRTELDAEMRATGYHMEDYSELLDSAITRKLLIQEAQRQKIDKEESFRRSLKTFYEQSLVKVLMDRQYGDIKVEVTEEEVVKYLSCFGSTVRFTRFPVSGSPPYTINESEGVESTILFDDLAETMQITLAGLTEGETSTRFDTGNDLYVLRLDQKTTAAGLLSNPPEESYVRQLLMDYKRQGKMADWLNNLRKQANITIHTK